MCNILHNKEETHITHHTVGGNLLEYAGTLTMPTATVTTAKLLFNSVVSTTTAKCLIADIKNFYLNNMLSSPEYMKMHISDIPQYIINEYNLLALVNDKGFVYIKIVKGMYGLKQTGIISNQVLVKHLAQFGYHPFLFTLGIWRHETPSSRWWWMTSPSNTHLSKTQSISSTLSQVKYGILEDWEQTSTLASC